MQTNKEIELAERYINSTHVSVFLTGKAGTGKTTLLHQIASTVHKRCVVVAPTGVAAVNAGGVTIHSFFQLPFCPYLPDVKELVTEYQMPEGQRQLRKEKLRIIRTLDLLIIDEISMVRADLLDAIDYSLRRYRHSSRPFGGVQLLMIGDVQQLPPVVTDSEKPYMDKVYPSPFFFHSKALQRTEYVTIELKTVYRQQDEEFVSLLNNIRDNNFDDATLAKLNSRCIPDGGTAASKVNTHAIRLTTHNRQADVINQQRMDALTTKPYTFRATVSGNFPDSSAPTEATLTLKEGAQVMFVKNDSTGMHRYYNGKLGTVKKFIATDDETLVYVEDETGELISVGRERWENIKYEIDPKDNQIKQRVDGTFEQYPLKPAWAVTIHKAQGLTFDHVIIDAAQAFAYGQVYVALSRCRTLEGLTLSTPITKSAAFDNSDVLGFTRTFPPEQQVESNLESYQSQYFFDELFDLFDYSAVQHHLTRLNDIYQQRLKGTYAEQAAKMTDVIHNKVVDMLSVVERFRTQLTQIRLSAPEGVESPYLKERIAKAVPYFLQQTEQLIAATEPLLEVEIDNAAVEKDFKELAAAYREAVELKRACLQQADKSGFSVERHLKAKTDYRLAQDQAQSRPGKGRGKSLANPEVVYAGNRHPHLVAMLVQWRLETCRELGIPAFAIMKQKTLLEVADRLPKDEKSLIAVPGVGKQKVRRFGQDILRVIGIYCDQYGISFDHQMQRSLQEEYE